MLKNVSFNTTPYCQGGPKCEYQSLCDSLAFVLQLLESALISMPPCLVSDLQLTTVHDLNMYFSMPTCRECVC